MVNSQNLFCMKLDTLQCQLTYSFITFSDHYILCRTIFLELLFVANTQYCDEFIHSKCTVWIMWTYFISKIALNVHYNVPKQLVSIIFHLSVIRHFVTPSRIKTLGKWIEMNCNEIVRPVHIYFHSTWDQIDLYLFFFLFFTILQKRFIPSSPPMCWARPSSEGDAILGVEPLRGPRLAI